MARRSDEHRSRYGRYVGGDPLAPPVDLAEALEQIGEDVMAGYSPERAMREYLRRGGEQRAGLDDLARRVAEKRRELLDRHHLDGTMQQVRELLDSAVLAERKELARDVELDDDDRSFREMRLSNLSPSTAAAVSDLATYDWHSAEARDAYEQIKDLLGRELLDQRFAGMKQALEGATDADRAAVSEMLADLNDLLEAHGSGEDVTERFEEFMAKHGDFFPEDPQNVEELLDALAQRAAAAQRMLNSMTPEQREELMRLSAQAFGSAELMESLDRLDANLRALRPGEDWDAVEQFNGSEGLGLGDGTGVLQDLAELDQLADQLAQSYPGARMDDIDVDKLARQLGADAAVDARTLSELERALRESGFLARGSDGQLRLSPKAMRRLGQSLLKDVATRMSGRQGQRDLRQAGAAGEPSGASREWQFGDTEPWDVTRTVTNAVLREGFETGASAPSSTTGETGARAPWPTTGEPGARAPWPTTGEPGARAPWPTTGEPGASVPWPTTGEPGASAPSGRRVRIRISDVEVTETEARTQACVALLVDTSFSMAMDGRWVPMKRTALALHHLVRSRFRGDHLQLIGFGRHAEVMEIEQLTALDAMWAKGTNLHHGLLLANRHFRKHPNAQPVLLIVTDGEPTAHLERGGQVFFDYPPHPLTIAHSVAELDRSRRLGAQTTFFRLGEDPGLARFIDQLARRVDGRVVAPELDDLGAAVVGSYLGSRGPRPASAGPGGDFYGGRGFWVG